MNAKILAAIIAVVITVLAVTAIQAGLAAFDAEEADCRKHGGALAKTSRGWACVVIVRMGGDK